MTAALITAAVLAGLATTCLGLVDAGHELDVLLARLEYEAASLHRATGAAVEHGAPVDSIARPRAALRRTVDSLGATADRIVGATAPPYARGIARLLSASIDLVPSADTIDRALRDYLDQTEQAQAETARSTAAVDLRVRLLDLNYGMLVQRISEARERTWQGVARALTGVLLITLVSIAIGALAVGLPA